MKDDEKWPHIVYRDKEYSLVPDNGCYYHHASSSLGVCRGDVKLKNWLGNDFCVWHYNFLAPDKSKRMPEPTIFNPFTDRDIEVVMVKHNLNKVQAIVLLTDLHHFEQRRVGEIKAETNLLGRYRDPEEQATSEQDA